jgi:putative two-component system response regulator
MIPLMARILSILDAFDAMVSIRPYRGQRSIEEALSVIEDERFSGQWDPELTGVFIRMMQLMTKGHFSYA